MCTVLFIFGAAGCAVKSDKQKEELSLKFQHTAQDREVGETQSMITYENHYAYGIHYPAIGVEAIDSRIKAAAQEIADGFVKEVPNSKPKGELPTLSADYKMLSCDGQRQEQICQHRVRDKDRHSRQEHQDGQHRDARL